jgi:hypothetical protein
MKWDRKEFTMQNAITPSGFYAIHSDLASLKEFITN